ncbi:CDP-diacylglycerol--serine O-phosphatidyltransferase 1 [Hibiscus syriacus]|uniref:CDP-diacylglycerol--serine O-phosphatidyltransferase n=1 Tax=Hibiscus syriacus TaxID=106335 RepID=A0A6A3CF76_HIBSY|nr:CDP-diacylglycerol--serine O-phosphatidyltransferase 1 [Hibiscus syriacus]
MAKFSVGFEEDGEGPSNRVPKRQRAERVLDIEGSGQEESEEDEESEGEEAFEGGEEGAEESEGEEELEECGAEQGAMSPQTTRDGSISITLTDPEVLDCSICYEALSIPVFHRCRAIEKVLESVKVSCQNLKYGCKEAFSYSLKQKHEKTCSFAPCSCPLSECCFEGSSEELSAHFGNVHRYSATRFLYDCLETVTIGVSEKSLILREKMEGSLLILHNKVETLGNVVTLSRIGPSTERGFFYELIVKAQADVSTLKLQSSTKSSPKRVDSPQSLGFLLVPSQFFSASRQIKMDLRVWCSDQFSCSQRPSGAFNTFVSGAALFGQVVFSETPRPMEPNGHTRVRRRDHLIQENGDDGLLCFIDELNPWTAWAYNPRTISLLFIGACFLMGVLVMIAVFLAYCLLRTPTVLVRPHPAVWCLVHGMAVVYLVALTFLLFLAALKKNMERTCMHKTLQLNNVLECLSVYICCHPKLNKGLVIVALHSVFQKRDDARQLMKFLHPDLGVELPERSYGADCRIYTPENPSSRFKNVYETLFDQFVLAHIFGWWGKAILIRNQQLLWVLSIGLELMEFTFRHMLSNFNACWWDSIIFDICCVTGSLYWCELMCVVSAANMNLRFSDSSVYFDNIFDLLVGIWAGMHTVGYFDGRTYEWIGISRQPNISGKVKQTLLQFTRAQWDRDEWQPLLDPWRFIQVLSLCIVFLTVELNTFFLKLCLWIPPRNHVIVYRLILWWLIAIPTIREYSSYLQDRKPVKEVGSFCWLSFAICIIELLICIKFGHGMLQHDADILVRIVLVAYTPMITVIPIAF